MSDNRALGSQEEQVIRMRQGLRAPDDQQLELKSQDDDVLAKLRAIEARAFEMSGRLDEMRTEVGLRSAPAADAQIKDKIVDRLSGGRPSSRVNSGADVKIGTDTKRRGR